MVLRDLVFMEDFGILINYYKTNVFKHIIKHKSYEIQQNTNTNHSDGNSKSYVCGISVKFRDFKFNQSFKPNMGLEWNWNSNPIQSNKPNGTKVIWPRTVHLIYQRVISPLVPGRYWSETTIWVRKIKKNGRSRLLVIDWNRNE